MATRLPTLDEFKSHTMKVLDKPKFNRLGLNEVQKHWLIEQMFNWYVKHRKAMTTRTFSPMLEMAKTVG